MRSATITGVSWVILIVNVRCTLSGVARSVLSLALGVLLVILPIVNHVRTFFAIRHHNNQVQSALSEQQASIIFKREKRVFVNMLLVIALLLICLAPSLVLRMFPRLFYKLGIYDATYIWSTTLIFINSSINPVIYVTRNREIRNVVRSMVCY